MIAFGPVPSRRLGRSLGINNIPPKVCTYSCVYCQLGRTPDMRAERQEFYAPEQVARSVEEKVREVRGAGESINYLTFVPDGEPTLDINLGREIDLLRPLGIRIAVISNGSLIWREEVREALLKADWVSLKVDAVDGKVWRRIDRPHKSLRPDAIWAGMREFARAYTGVLVTETMLVAGVNDDEGSLCDVAELVAQLRPAVAYISVPTRPPAERWVRPPDEGTLNRAYQLLGQGGQRVEMLIGYEGDAFSATGDVEADLLSITSVHPMREEAVAEFLARAGSEWTIVHDLVARGQLVETEYGGARFYIRKLGS